MHANRFVGKIYFYRMVQALGAFIHRDHALAFFSWDSRFSQVVFEPARDDDNTFLIMSQVAQIQLMPTYQRWCAFAHIAQTTEMIDVSVGDQYMRQVIQP